MDHKPKHTGKGYVYSNTIIERLTRTHISLPLSIFSGISIYLLYAGTFEKGLPGIRVGVLFLAGLLFFSLIEYLLHRYLFHLPETTPMRKKMVYIMHGIHHDYPKDKDRLAMPIPASLLVSFLFFLLYQLILGDMVYGFLPGFLMGYAAYLGVHYMVHAYQPPKNFFRILWVHHGIHHYKQPERAFGVSSPLWDLVFRTMPR